MLRKIIGLVDFIENELNLRETKAAHVDLAKLIFTIFYTCHFFGCGFRSLASYEISIG